MQTIDEMRGETGLPVVIADQDGLITYVNGHFKTVFGWTEAEVMGRPLTILIPPGLHDAHQLGFSRFLTTGKATLLNQSLKLRAVTKDGREFDAEHIITAEQSQGRWVFGATIRPLSSD